MKQFIVGILLVSSMFFASDVAAAEPEHTEIIEQPAEHNSATLEATVLAPDTSATELTAPALGEHRPAQNIEELSLGKVTFEVPRETIDLKEHYEMPDGIPAPLTAEQYAKLLYEANKYLGYKYVGGGYKPSTSFDCSGYVSWVLNNSDIGVRVNTHSVSGLYTYCTKVSEDELRVGDLVFFVGTHKKGLSHVGIYVGNGKMLHCGDAGVEYTNLAYRYWIKHFYAYGRLNG